MSLSEPVRSEADLFARVRPHPALRGLTLDGVGPVWLQIRRALAQRILTGDWRTGAQIPPELDLRDHFQTSRGTVNKAIQSLVNEGLLQRRRRVGTVVTGRAQERPVFEIWDTADVVARAGGVYGYRLLDCSFLAEGDPRRGFMEIDRGARLIWMRCLHLSNGRPFQLEERLVNVEAAPGITCQPMEDVGPGPWLIAHVPWTEAEHAISAAAAGDEQALALEVTPGSPCLVVERRTWNGDEAVTYVRLWNPGPDHRLVGRFQPAR